MRTGAFAATRLDEGRTWKWPLLLAAPFLLCLAVLLVTGWTFPTFWGGDEVSHWALMQWFSKGLPRFKADYPLTATTPLFHLAGACLVRLFGPNLALVRTCNTLLSIGVVLALFRLLHRRLGQDKASAALLGGVFLSSCYYFGYAFRLLTDNMALLGCLFAMIELFRFVDAAEPRPLVRYLWACFWYALAILTRQSYIFLGLPLAALLLLSPLVRRQKGIGMGMLGLAVVPFALLAVAWHGLVPPGFQEHHTPSVINLYPLALPLMLLGLYTPVFFGPDLVRRLRAGSLDRRRSLPPAAGISAALGVLWCYPLFPVRGHPEMAPYFPALAQVDFSKCFGGWMYSVADRVGWFSLRHNSLIFWATLPPGAAAAVWFVPEAWRTADPRRRVAAWFLLSVLLSSMLNSVSAQKYYDGLVLLYLVWRSRPGAASDPWRRWAFAGLILVFCVYAIAFPYVTNTNGFIAAPLGELPPPP